MLGNGLFALLARPFAPSPIGSAAQARACADCLPFSTRPAQTLASPGERPVSQFHTEKAIERLPGIPELVDAVLAEVDKVEDREEAAALRAELEPAAAAAREALEGFGSWLSDELLPQATGDFRLGPALYRDKFRHALRVDMQPTELRARAQAAFDVVRAEMLRLATELWPTWKGRAHARAVGRHRPRRPGRHRGRPPGGRASCSDFCRAENERIETFCRDIGLIGLADEPLEIMWTPEFLRSFGGAMLIPPGPLDKGPVELLRHHPHARRLDR